MANIVQKATKASLVIILGLLLAACGSKINQTNFEKVQQGMSLEQVTQILGSPTNTASISFGGMSGTSATWKTHDAQIDIQLFNNQVKIKNFVKGVIQNDNGQ